MGKAFGAGTYVAETGPVVPLFWALSPDILP